MDNSKKLSLTDWDRLYPAAAEGDIAAGAQLDEHGLRMAIAELERLGKRLPPDLRTDGSPVVAPGAPVELLNIDKTKATRTRVSEPMWVGSGYIWREARLARKHMHDGGLISLDMAFSTAVTNRVRVRIAEAARLFRFRWMTGGRAEMVRDVTHSGMSLSAALDDAADDGESQTLQDVHYSQSADVFATLPTEPEEVDAGLIGPTTQALHTAGYDWLAPKSTKGIVKALAVSFDVSEKTVRNRVRGEFDGFRAAQPAAVDWRGLRSHYPALIRYRGFWHGLGEAFAHTPALAEGCYSGTPRHLRKRRTLWRPDLYHGDWWDIPRVLSAAECAALPHRAPVPSPKLSKTDVREAVRHERAVLADLSEGVSEGSGTGMRLQRAERIANTRAAATGAGTHCFDGDYAQPAVRQRHAQILKTGTVSRRLQQIRAGRIEELKEGRLVDV